MFNLALSLFVVGFIALGVRRPFLWVLAYLYIDIVAPQKITYAILPSLQISLVAFIAAFGGWLLADDKRNSRFSLRQTLMLVLLVYCGISTMSADFPVEALAKWGWVWKALLFAIFLPLTLRTRLRIEATALVMVLGAATIIISGSIKTVLGGGGYGSLHLLVNDNTGLYEGSIISTVAIAVIPVVVWVARHGTIFPSDWRVKLFAAALVFACLLMPIGTQARTGLLCIGLLAILSLRTAKRRFLYVTLMAVAAFAAIPFLPESYTKRMSTIENHAADESASTRVAVWAWTMDYVKDHPFGGGFDAYRQNKLSYQTKSADVAGNNTAVAVADVQDKARAYHSSYFEMLGEQGWPGLAVWLWLQLLGLWQMERLRSRWNKRAAEHPGDAAFAWQSPLANALQQTQLIYLAGSLFVGIAFQPFVLMLIGLQCGLWSYLRRIDSPQRPSAIRPRRAPIVNAVAAS
ncbi:MAG TPA: DUF5935 domain-containing protein [Novosphingobium sp.]|nr:DUF5935 domain-containing protein [Novosphingobium sp.]